MIVTMTKLEGGEALRSNSVTGMIYIGISGLSRFPEVGEVPFILNNRPLNKNNGENMRGVNTSPIVSYEDTEKGREVVTESGSKYLFEEEL